MTRTIVLSLLWLWTTPTWADYLYTCNFEYYYSFRFPISDQKDLKAEDFLGIKKEDDFSIMFIVRDDGSASMIGNIGTSPVTVIQQYGGNSLSFVERTPFGNIMLTTIDGSTMNAVHSRHYLGLVGPFMPSQSYGSCIKQ